MTGDAHSIEETIVRDLARFSFFPHVSVRLDMKLHDIPNLG